MKTKKQPKVIQMTDYIHTNVVTGGQINLSIEDARALYNLTEATPDEDKWQEKLMASRDVLRKMAKAILFIAGDATPLNDIMEGLVTNTPPVRGAILTSTVEAADGKLSKEDINTLEKHS